MIPDLTSQDILLLKGFHLLNSEGKRDLLDYLGFVAQKQYRAELFSQVLNNPLLYRGLLQAAKMCEREDIEMEEILQKISQVKYMFYNLLERINTKYDEVLDSNYLDGLVRDWGRIGFENVAEAAKNKRKDLVFRELQEMIYGLENLTEKGDKKRFIAV